MSILQTSMARFSCITVVFFVAEITQSLAAMAVSAAIIWQLEMKGVCKDGTIAQLHDLTSCQVCCCADVGERKRHEARAKNWRNTAGILNYQTDIQHFSKTP